MMGWEAPLMERHAAVICGQGGRHYLNVGFGLGIIDNLIQVGHAGRFHRAGQPVLSVRCRQVAMVAQSACSEQYVMTGACTSIFLYGVLTCCFCVSLMRVVAVEELNCICSWWPSNILPSTYIHMLLVFGISPKQ